MVQPASWVRRPAVHFVFLGLLLFVGDLAGGGWRSSLFTSRPRIVISAQQIEALRQEAAVRSGRRPGEDRLRELVRAAVEEELLVREALRLGLHRDDPAVRERLVLDLRFLGETGDEDELAARALALDGVSTDPVWTNLLAGDPVVRRRLVELIEERIARTVFGGVTEGPGQAELAAFFEEHGAAFEEPPMVRFHHVFVDGHGDEDERRALELLAALELDGRGPEAALARGDEFVFGRREQWRTREELTKAYGPEFAAVVAEEGRLPERRWTGPVRSNWGLHLVWIDERRAARRPRLEEVQGEVERRLWASRFREARARELERLARRSRIVVEGRR